MPMKLVYGFETYNPFTKITEVDNFRKDLKIAFKAFVKEGSWSIISGDLTWFHNCIVASENNSAVWGDELPIRIAVTPADFLEGMADGLEATDSCGFESFEAEMIELEGYLAKWKRTIAKCESLMEKKREEVRKEMEAESK